MYSLSSFAKTSRFPGLGTHRIRTMTTVLQGKDSSSDGMPWKNKDVVAVSVAAVGVLTAIVSGAMVGTAYTISTTKDLHEKLALAKMEAEKDLQAAKMEAKKDMEAAKMEAKKDMEAAKIEAKQLVAEAKTETAERFLLYGYAAEFLEYQKRLKLGDHWKEESAEKS